MTEKQRKLLFVLAKQRGMDNELLHSYVETQTGKQKYYRSNNTRSKNIDRWIAGKETNSKRIYYGKQLKYVKGLCQCLSWEEKALRQFIEKQYGISNVNWLTSKQAAKLIEGLKVYGKKIKEGDKKPSFIVCTLFCLF